MNNMPDVSVGATAIGREGNLLVDFGHAHFIVSIMRTVNINIIYAQATQ